MKNLKIFTVFITLLFATPVMGKTRVAVSTFKDKTGDERCNVRRWFGNSLGTGFQEQLITELSDISKFSIQERTNLNKMYNEEHNLINSDHRAAPKKNRFKAAHYSITGAVTSFEMCESGMGGKVDVGGLFGMKNSGLKVGGKRHNAKVKLDIRIVDVESGEIVKAFSTEGSASATGLDLEGDIKGADFESDAFKNTPIGEATREALGEAAQIIAKSLPGNRKDPSLQQADRSKKKLRTKAKRRGGRKVAQKRKAGRVQSTQSSLRQFCPYENSKIQMCKIVSKSKSGKRLQALLLKRSEKKLYKPEDVVTLGKIKKTPQVGQQVYVPCSAATKGCYRSEYKYVFMECTVVDGFDSESVLTCRGDEFQVDNSLIFSQAKKKTTSIAGN